MSLCGGEEGRRLTLSPTIPWPTKYLPNRSTTSSCSSGERLVIAVSRIPPTLARWFTAMKD